jgi:hypothetical protein
MVELNLNQAGLLSAFVTAVVLLAFSLTVGALCRFRGPGRSYAVFGVGFSLAAAFSHIASSFLDINLRGPTIVPSAKGPDADTYWMSLVFNAASMLMTLAWTWGAIRLLDSYGGRPFRWMGWLGSTLAVAAIVPSLWGPQFIQADALWTWVANAAAFAYMVPVGCMAASGLIMAYARQRQRRAGQAILASALSAYPIAWATWTSLSLAALSWHLAIGSLFVAASAFAATQFGWLRLRLRGGGREAIAVVAVADLFLLLGIVMGLFFPEESPSGAARIYDVVLVAYAVLRLQYLDLDLKVRWGISKGTVAGIVVAVVFVASEGAQLVFGEDKQWLGLAVGGLVVFAIAPLQRAAEKLAERAVPVASGPQGRTSAEAIYCEAFLAASRDGKVTRREEIHLARIADRLGIGVERALELRETASREPT